MEVLAAPDNKEGAEFSTDLSPDEPLRPGQADFAGFTVAELKMREERGDNEKNGLKRFISPQ